MTLYNKWNALLHAQGIDTNDTVKPAPPIGLISIYQKVCIPQQSIACEIDLNDIECNEDSAFHKNNQPVFAYLRIGKRSYRSPTVHFTYCQALKTLSPGKLFCTTRQDGEFEIDHETKNGIETKTETLKPCEFCIGAYFGLTNKEDSQTRKTIANNFDYSRLLQELGVTLNNAVWYTRLYRYTDKSWEERSDEIRERMQWTCQKCGIHIGKENRFLLHTHHITGDRNFNHHANLTALCIRCHAEEPGHEHLKSYWQYSQFMTLLEVGHFTLYSGSLENKQR